MERTAGTLSGIDAPAAPTRVHCPHLPRRKNGARTTQEWVADGPRYRAQPGDEGRTRVGKGGPLHQGGVGGMERADRRAAVVGEPGATHRLTVCASRELVCGQKAHSRRPRFRSGAFEVAVRSSRVPATHSCCGTRPHLRPLNYDATRSREGCVG